MMQDKTITQNTEAAGIGDHHGEVVDRGEYDYDISNEDRSMQQYSNGLRRTEHQLR